MVVYCPFGRHVHIDHLDGSAAVNNLKHDGLAIWVVCKTVALQLGFPPNHNSHIAGRGRDSCVSVCVHTMKHK